ncbi:MAG: hypothetical protein GXO47_01120 [Chlorobi bacterium]|nr:hypothetical protein [Chlorobiota bacterium]
MKFQKYLLAYVFFVTGVVFTSCDDDNKVNDKPVVLPSNRITSVYIDDEDVKWFGTTEGLVSFDGEQWTVYSTDDGVAGEHINQLSCQKSAAGNELWVATNDGVSVLAYDIDGITSATVYAIDNSGLISDTVTALTVDAGNVRWFATDEGVSIFAVSDWLSLTYSEMRHKKIISMGSASDGWNYMGTEGDGVARYRFDEVDGITGASLIDTDWSRIPDDNVLSVCVVSDTCQWYGTTKGAGCHVGRDTRLGWTVYTKDEGLINDTVTAIFEDSKGVVWFGSPDGLCSFDGENWNYYTKENGLSDNKINDICEDSGGSVWIATDNGISVYDGSSWTVYKQL